MTIALSLLRSLRFPLRFIVPLILALLTCAYLIVPLIDSLTLGWFSRDLDLRSKVLASALSDSITDAARNNDGQRLLPLFNRTVSDERLLAIALCSPDGRLIERTSEFPDSLTCNSAHAIADQPEHLLKLKQGSVHVAVCPVESGHGIVGNLVLLHDLSFVERRSRVTRNYLIIVFAILGVVISLITVIAAHVSRRGWMAGVKSVLRGESLLQPVGSPAPEFAPLASDLRIMLRQLEDEHRRAHSADDVWTAARLKSMLKSDLRDAQVIVVSNREPYIHEKNDGGIFLVRPASGLVTAIEPIMRACSGTWIAHGSGSADREMVDARDHLAVPISQPAYTLRRMWLTETEEHGYYYGLANEGLWPLCHIAHVRPVFRQSDWDSYRRVNRQFADAVVAEARIEDPLVLVQDYHFALAPRMIREKLPRATIISFWHIPWPNPEAFGICPWRKEILHGMLGSTIIGFQTRFHCKNFMETVDRFLETRIEQEHSSISFLNQKTLVESYPISIHWPSPQEGAALPPIAICRANLRKELGVADDHLIVLGIDRFDYTKGIIERFNAFERLLEKHPEFIGRLTFLQVAAPTRSLLIEYQSFQHRIRELVAHINQHFGREDYQPIRLIAEHQNSDQVNRLYRAADVCAVTSIHDGMNLVCKEFIAARDDEQGVLILSQFAGAAREMSEALQINPYHVEETADALFSAVSMPKAEQRERMMNLRAVVMEHNVYRWAGSILTDAAKLRLRERIEARLQSHRANFS
ncbi:MAG TPA: trehalose-6-phosphate synthase [Rhodocyclaceae bacterium]|nr:trehalose-6-phosphate synthase [Rhodocyclaceae bacterium]